MWSVTDCTGDGAHRAVAESVLSVGPTGHDADAGARGLGLSVSAWGEAMVARVPTFCRINRVRRRGGGAWDGSSVSAPDEAIVAQMSTFRS